jgi:transposase
MSRRSRSRNPVQFPLARLPLRPPCEVLGTRANMAELKDLVVPADARLLRVGELSRSAMIDAELVEFDKQPAGFARAETRVRRLLPIPGINDVVAPKPLTSRGHIARSRDCDHAASYPGLVPSIERSGLKGYHGPNTKAGSPQIRGPLTQVTRHDGRHPGPICSFSAGWPGGGAARWRSRRWRASW